MRRICTLLTLITLAIQVSAQTTLVVENTDKQPLPVAELASRGIGSIPYVFVGKVLSLKTSVLRNGNSNYFPNGSAISYMTVEVQKVLKGDLKAGTVEVHVYAEGYYERDGDEIIGYSPPTHEGMIIRRAGYSGIFFCVPSDISLTERPTTSNPIPLTTAFNIVRFSNNLNDEFHSKGTHLLFRKKTDLYNTLKHFNLLKEGEDVFPDPLPTPPVAVSSTPTIEGQISNDRAQYEKAIADMEYRYREMQKQKDK